MSTPDYSQNTTDIITFEGIRTPGDKSLNLPNLYNERVNIISKSYQENFIEGVANYIDPGLGFETEIESITYNVTTATGKFEGYTKITIYIDNTNKTRIVEIY